MTGTIRRFEFGGEPSSDPAMSETLHIYGNRGSVEHVINRIIVCWKRKWWKKLMEILLESMLSIRGAVRKLIYAE